MKTHPHSRIYVGKQLAAQDELAAITKRQVMHVVSRCADGSPLEMDEALKPPRDWRLVVAVCGIGVGLAGLFVSLLWTIVTSN